MKPRSACRYHAGCILAAVIAAASPLSAQESGLTITFLANEGVMLSSSRQKVLIDALFVRYGRYPVPGDSTQRALRIGRPPFNDTDLVLITHWHGDHFGPAPVIDHMLANPRALLATSPQVIDSLSRSPRSGRVAKARLLSRTAPSATRRREVINGIPVEFLGLSHGSGRHRHVQHLGFIVEIGGQRVLHAGDSDFSASEYAALRLDTARIDIGMLPAWALLEQADVVRKWIKPRQTIGIHMSIGDEKQAGRIRTAWPRAVAFIRSLQRLSVTR